MDNDLTHLLRVELHRWRDRAFLFQVVNGALVLRIRELERRCERLKSASSGSGTSPRGRRSPSRGCSTGGRGKYAGGPCGRCGRERNTEYEFCIFCGGTPGLDA
jgi:hypothetical protein